MVNKYDDELKRKIINEHISGKTVSDLKEKYHISDTTIYSWIKESKKNLVKDREYIQILESENIRLKEDIKILRNAMEIISRK